MELSKIFKMVHYSVPSHVQRIKVGELWSTNHGDLEVQLYRENRIFLEYHISAPRECCAPKFLIKCPSLVSLHPTGDGGSPNNFFQRGVKNWLIIQRMSQ